VVEIRLVNFGEDVARKHRQMLNESLREDDTSRHPLIAYINQWEQTSLEKIRHIARDARREITRLEELRRGTFYRLRSALVLIKLSFQ
jgi:hypothetical protein